MQKKLFFNIHTLLTSFNKIPNQKKEKKERKNIYLQVNGFKGLEKTFTNYGAQGVEKLSKNHLVLSLISSWKKRFRFKGNCL